MEDLSKLTNDQIVSQLAFSIANMDTIKEYIREAAKRLSSPPDLPETSRSSHYS